MVSLPPAIARHERAGRSLQAVGSMSRKPKGPGFSGQNKKKCVVEIKKILKFTL